MVGSLTTSYQEFTYGSSSPWENIYVKKSSDGKTIYWYLYNYYGDGPNGTGTHYNLAIK